MSTFQEIADRLTRRLAPDAELRMEVSHELRCHLEDAAEEFRRGGYSEADAAAAAVKALGEEEHLAEMLYIANRSRMRLRAVAKWAARLALLPAAVAAVILLTTGIFPFYTDKDTGLPVPGGMDETIYHSGLTDEQKFLFTGAPGAKTPLEKAKSISDRWPENPVYFGDYFCAFVSDKWHTDQHDKPMPPAVEKEFLELVARGEKLDPDNAFYPLTEAGYWLKFSTKVEEDKSKTYELTDRSGKIQQHTGNKITIIDPRAYEKGLAAFELAAKKTKWALPTIQMLDVRLNLLPPPRSMQQLVSRWSMEVAVLLPSLGATRNSCRALTARAYELSQEGKRDEAFGFFHDVRWVAELQGAGSRTIIELLVAQACMTNMFSEEMFAYEAMGDNEAAQKARERLRNWNEQYVSLWKNVDSKKLDRKIMQGGSMFHQILLPAVPDLTADLGPLRETEYALYDRFALAALLAVVTGMAAMVMLVGGVSVLMHRGAPESPKLLFVGWRRMGMILLKAVVLPLGVYAVYAHLTKLGGREYGFFYAWPRVTAEAALLAATVLWLLMRSARQAIYERARDAGIAVPAAKKGIGFFGWAYLVLAGMSVVFIARGHFRMDFQDMEFNQPAGVILAIAWGLWLIFWSGLGALRALMGSVETRHFRRTLVRSLAPVLCAAVIVTAIPCGAMLVRQEAAAVSRAEGSAGLDFRSEIERSGFKKLRESFQRELAEMDRPPVVKDHP
jgi:hypothetical protein